LILPKVAIRPLIGIGARNFPQTECRVYLIQAALGVHSFLIAHTGRGTPTRISMVSAVMDADGCNPANRREVIMTNRVPSRHFARTCIFCASGNGGSARSPCSAWRSAWCSRLPRISSIRPPRSCWCSRPPLRAGWVWHSSRSPDGRGDRVAAGYQRTGAAGGARSAEEHASGIGVGVGQTNVMPSPPPARYRPARH